MINTEQNRLYNDRFFGPGRDRKRAAFLIYEQIATLPLVCPHTHVDPAMFSDEGFSFGSPSQLLLIPDHYILRMLYSQGIPLEKMGIPTKDGSAFETDHRRIWQIFAENFYLFRGTPVSLWLTHELHFVFGIKKSLSGSSAMEIYEAIEKKLAAKSFRPRLLFEKFNIETLCTTDSINDSLQHHDLIRRSGWNGVVLPTFRPDSVVNIDTPGWKENIDRLSEITGIDISSYRRYIEAVEKRRDFFRERGAKAADHGVETPYTGRLPENEAEEIFKRALNNKASKSDTELFCGHMLMESARMSSEDGLVMQLHAGCFRNHNSRVFRKFGPDKGCDIPLRTEFTINLLPLLNEYGNNPVFRIILFTMDEAGYSRELAPLAAHYPAVRLGPPWWFNDSINGMERYFNSVIETAGLYNTAGFNDDTRAFPSIPARHDLWRRMVSNWLAGLVVRRVVGMDEASDMAKEAAYGLAKRAYNLM